MKFHRRSLRFVALTIAITLPLLGTTGVASAKTAKGCHKTHVCHSGGGTGTGGATPGPITVQVDPNPLVEVGQSFVPATIQVETSPSFAGDLVNISSSQLAASCVQLNFGHQAPFMSGADNMTVTLDDDGNATVLVAGYNCAPGTSVIEADLEVAPYYTAVTTLTALPPVVSPTGVTGYPTTSGTVTTGEVETGDTKASGDSDVYAVFYVETSPVYAEQQVEITSPELQDRCGGGWVWAAYSASGVSIVADPTSIQGTIDDDGNVAFEFAGISCAAGTSTIIADVLAGDHPTYTTTFNIVAPQPTI
jgi:hypothetical protein